MVVVAYVHFVLCFFRRPGCDISLLVAFAFVPLTDPVPTCHLRYVVALATGSSLSLPPIAYATVASKARLTPECVVPIR